MTCGSCVANVKKLLEQVPGITAARVSLYPPVASLDMERHVGLPELKAALASHPKYQISEASAKVPVHAMPPAPAIMEAEENQSWFENYKPILLIFGYISLVTLLIQSGNHHFDLMQWMRHFMAGFFLVFSFFKLLNLKGFAESYAMYDVIARRVPLWGYAYALIELALGLAFLTNFHPMLTNLATLIVMSVSIIGVLQSVLNKRKIQCACLGAIFNLPMSTVTIIEDALMIGMSATMLFLIA